MSTTCRTRQVAPGQGVIDLSVARGHCAGADVLYRVIVDRRTWVGAGVSVAVLSAMLAICCVAACGGGLFLFSGRYKPCISGRPADLVAADLIGRYTSSSSNGQLDLQARGRFTATSFVIRDREPVSLSGAGSWSLLPEDSPLGDVDLDFDDQSIGATIRVSGTRSQPVLYRYIGDPDSCRLERFERT